MKKAILLLALLFVLIPMQVGAFSVTLGWDASSSTDIKDYIICYDTFSGAGKTQSKNVGSALTGTILNLVEDTMYYFHVIVTDWEGRYSGPSNEVRTDGIESPDTGEDPVAPGGCYIVTVTP